MKKPITILLCTLICMCCDLSAQQRSVVVDLSGYYNIDYAYRTVDFAAIDNTAFERDAMKSLYKRGLVGKGEKCGFSYVYLAMINPELKEVGTSDELLQNINLCSTDGKLAKAHGPIWRKAYVCDASGALIGLTDGGNSFVYEPLNAKERWQAELAIINQYDTFIHLSCGLISDTYSLGIKDGRCHLVNLDSGQVIDVDEARTNDIRKLLFGDVVIIDMSSTNFDNVATFNAAQWTSNKSMINAIDEPMITIANATHQRIWE